MGNNTIKLVTDEHGEQFRVPVKCMTPTHSTVQKVRVEVAHERGKNIGVFSQSLLHIHEELVPFGGSTNGDGYTSYLINDEKAKYIITELQRMLDYA